MSNDLAPRNLSGAAQRWAPETHDAYRRVWVEQQGPYIMRDRQGVPLNPAQGYQGFPSMSQLAAETLGMPSGGGGQTMRNGRQTALGELGSADMVTRIETAVAVIVHDFHDHGQAAGMRAAARWGLTDGAKLYVAIRADTEEALAARLARLQADLKRQPQNPKLIAARAFVFLRLHEVRNAIKSNFSAPQAIADRPEIPRREIPRWLSLTALGASAVAIFMSLARSR